MGTTNTACYYISRDIYISRDRLLLFKRVVRYPLYILDDVMNSSSSGALAANYRFYPSTSIRVDDKRGSFLVGERERERL